jgi:cell division protein FtsX
LTDNLKNYRLPKSTILVKKKNPRCHRTLRVFGVLCFGFLYKGDPSVETKEVAGVLESKSFVESIEIETKEETLNRLKQFFQEKEYLFSAFQESNLPDVISLELKDKGDITYVAEQLKSINGITDVVYAQKFA